MTEPPAEIIERARAAIRLNASSFDPGCRCTMCRLHLTEIAAFALSERALARKEALEEAGARREVTVDDAERLRKALSWVGHATPESLEALCFQYDDYVRKLVLQLCAQSDRAYAIRSLIEQPGGGRTP